MLLGKFPDLFFKLCKSHNYVDIIYQMLLLLLTQNTHEYYQSYGMELDTAKGHWLVMKSQVWSANSVFVTFCNTTTYTHRHRSYKHIHILT